MNKILLSKNLPVGNIIKIERYDSGIINRVYKIVTGKGIFTLRIYKDKLPKDFAFEISLFNHLRKLPTPHLITINGRQYTKIGKDYAILYQYIPGKHLKNLTLNQLQEVGKFIGTFHNRGKSFNWNKPRDRYYHFTKKRIDKYKTIIVRSKIQHLDQLNDIVSIMKKNLLSNSLLSGPIHVDIKLDNIIFLDDKLSGVLDFDNAYIGPYILDVAKAVVWLGVKNNKFDLENALAIYQGYNHKRKITKQEHNELYKSVKYAFISHIFVDYYNRAQGIISKDYFDFMAIDFYRRYKSFNISEDEFYSKLKI